MASLIVKNVTANIVAKIWNILSLYLFVPIWIHFLGVEGYGVISFYTILMTLAYFADAGLTATLTREFARGDIDDQYRRDLLRTIELIYLGIVFVLFVVIFSFSGFLVTHFLKTDSYSFEELRLCVRIMSLTMSFNFMFSLYNGGLFGLQRQVVGNIISISYSIMRSAVVVVPLLFYPTLETFFIWQLFSIVFSVIVVRLILVRKISVTGNQAVFRPEYLKSIWKYALGMMLMAIISALNTQLDKLVTGNVLSLEDMGFYSLASTIGIAVISIAQPIGVAFYPELTRLLSVNRKKIEELLLIFSFIISAISVIIGMTLFLYIDSYAYLWTHDMVIVNAIRIPARLLIIGNTLQCLQLPPYYLALANGHTKTNVKLGSLMLLFMIPSVYLFTQQWGLSGTAVPYVILNILATIYLAYVILKLFFKERILEWMRYILKPFMSGLAILLLFYALYYVWIDHFNALTAFIYSALICMLDVFICARLLVRMSPDIIGYVPIKLRKYLLKKQS